MRDWECGLICLCVFLFGCSGKPDPAVLAGIEQVHALGGTFIVQGNTVPVKKGGKLPTSAFQVSQVDLNQKKVRDDQMEKLAGLTQLEILNAESSFLTDKGLGHLAAFKKLRELDLHKSQYITDKGLEALKSLPNLNKLELSYTRISDQAIDNLSALKNLKILYLTGTRITGEGLKKLRAALPHCEILK